LTEPKSDLKPRRLSNVTTFKKTLIDFKKDIYFENWRVSDEEMRVDSGVQWHIEKRRLRGGRQDCIDIVEVDNGRFSFVIVPTRGMGIWKGEFDGCFLGWGSPVKRLVHPHYINLEDRGGLGWLGGYNEWVVRCGLESNGAPCEDTIIDNVGKPKQVRLTLHGKVANIPASKVEAYVKVEKPFELGVEGVVYEESMFGPNMKLSTTITTAVESNWIRISDVIENLRAVPTEMQLLYHCNYGPPFLEEGSHLIAPVQRLAPRDERASEGTERFSTFGPPEPGFVEQVYFIKLIGDKDGYTNVMLANKNETKAISVGLSINQLPYFTLWKNTASLEDGYVVGLEPATNFPNPKPFERRMGRVVNLKPREKYAAEVTLAVHLGEEDVEKAKGRIELQSKVKPEIYTKPIPDFSPI